MKRSSGLVNLIQVANEWTLHKIGVVRKSRGRRSRTARQGGDPASPTDSGAGAVPLLLTLARSSAVSTRRGSHARLAHLVGDGLLTVPAGWRWRPHRGWTGPGAGRLATRPAEPIFQTPLPLRYAERYHTGVTTQIAVRLSDEDLGYIDQLVAEGKAKSRADAVRGFIDAARKASRDAADAAAYAATDDPDDLEALARWAGGQRLDVE